MTDNDLKALLEANEAETRRHFDVAVERLETKVDLVAAETHGYFDVAVERLETKVDLVAAETRGHFDIASEELKHEIRLVAEKVTQVDEKLDREAAHIREEMRRGFADTQAMIKFSHAELDRRVHALEDTQRTLEESLADLQARVERLETSTH